MWYKTPCTNYYESTGNLSAIYFLLKSPHHTKLVLTPFWKKCSRMGLNCVQTGWTENQLLAVCLRTSWMGSDRFDQEWCYRTLILLKIFGQPSQLAIRRNGNVRGSTDVLDIVRSGFILMYKEFWQYSPHSSIRRSSYYSPSWSLSLHRIHTVRRS